MIKYIPLLSSFTKILERISNKKYIEILYLNIVLYYWQPSFNMDQKIHTKITKSWCIETSIQSITLVRSGSGFFTSVRIHIQIQLFTLMQFPIRVCYANPDPHQSDANPQHRPNDPPLSRVNCMWASTESFISLWFGSICESSFSLWRGSGSDFPIWSGSGSGSAHWQALFVFTGQVPTSFCIQI